jgi:hypothetical protein
MQHYRVYVIGHDGLCVKAVDIGCEDDAAAVNETKAMLDGLDLELWQRDRRIARFDGTPE